MHDIDWDNIIGKSLPSINIYRKDAIRHVSGQFGINPVLVLSKLVQDQKKTLHTLKSDEDFSLSIKSFANDLSRHGQEFSAAKSEIEMSRLEYSFHFFQIAGKPHYIHNQKVCGAYNTKKINKEAR